MGFLSSRDFRAENLNKHLSESLPPSRQRAKRKSGAPFERAGPELKSTPTPL
jgi:hypothetical protein